MLGQIVGAVGEKFLDFGLQRELNRESAEWNRQQVNDQQAWQQRMSDSAHQREVKDLIAAGLNPVLSAKYGGASTPSGGAASMSPQMSFPQIIPTMLELMKIDQSQQRLNMEQDLLNPKKKNIEAGTGLKRAQEAASGKGAIRSTVEKEISTVIKDGLQWLKKIKPPVNNQYLPNQKMP